MTDDEMHEHDRLLDYPELRRFIPYSKVHLGRLEAQGRFPGRVQLGPGRVGWSLLEVQQWIRDRKAGRKEMLEA